MKLRKPTKKEVILIVLLYFISFALAGVIFGQFTYLLAWSVSIFIVAWIGYWTIRYIIDTQEYIESMFPLMSDKNKKKLKK